ncbi:MAG: aldehyde-activating protein [Gammaproteobacteria bacterium]|nr:aldehyde-activating protein [Gammaproteobacteria bacterium]
MNKIEGGCLCGEVRYSGEAEPMMVVVCHCTDCQKHSGGACSINVLLPRDVLQFEGQLNTYIGKGDSGHDVNRKFCGNCGSAIYNLPALMQDIFVLKAGTLDDVSWLEPTVEIYCDSAQEWAKIAEGVESFPGMMPG